MNNRIALAGVAGLLMVVFAGADIGVAAEQPVSTLVAGAVASPDRYGALAAAEILKAGGNAVDAAVATGFALAVTYPEAGNLGGGGFMTLYVEGKPYFLDYRECAPGNASANMYLDANGNAVAERSLYGNLATAVPGTVRGLAEAHRRFGKLAWRRDLAPAIRFARRGFLVTAQLIKIRDEEIASLSKVTNFATYYGALHAGQRYRQSELAATLQRISANGERDFYEGTTADLLIAQMHRGAAVGLINKSDLARYRAIWREPVMGDWRELRIITAPPPSSGGIALLQMLRMKQDAAPLFQNVMRNSPQYLHLLAEIEKRVFADRAQYLGDPDFIQVPMRELIDAAYLAARARQIDAKEPSSMHDVQPGLEKPQTTHFSIVDRWGNAVSNTYTLNGWFGSGVVVEGAGFLLNDEMDDFSAKKGVANQYGVVGADANAIAPLKRPLSSMTPTILLKDGKVAMVIGTPGGSRIFTSVFQVLANVYDYGLPLRLAVDSPRYHHQLVPQNTLYAEPYAPFQADLAGSMTARGYRLETQTFNGDIEAIQIVGREPRVSADPRARGVALLIR